MPQYCYQIKIKTPGVYTIWTENPPDNVPGIYQDIHDFFGDEVEIEEILEMGQSDAMGFPKMTVEANFDETRPPTDFEPKNVDTPETEIHNGVLPEFGSEDEDYTISVQAG